MATSKAKKTEILKDLDQSMKDAKSVVFMDVHGITVEDFMKLRKSLRDKKVKTKVAKKTLIRITGKKHGYDIDENLLNGQIACAFSMEDEIAAAQEIYKAGIKNEKPKIIGGIFEKKVVGIDMMLALAQLPTKEELYAKLVGSIKMPVSGFYATLSGVLRGFVQVLKQVSEKKPA